MADKWPLANGNWSNAANWNGGTKPVAGDDVYADGRTLNVDESFDVATLRTTQRSGGTIGGTFDFNTAGVTGTVTNSTQGFFQGTTANAITITAASGTVTLSFNSNFGNNNAITLMQYTGLCNLTMTAKAFNSIQINPISGGIVLINKTSSGTITLNGNVVSGNGNGANQNNTLLSTAGATIVNGNISGFGSGNSGPNYGISQSGGTLVVNGNVTGGFGIGGNVNRGILFSGTLMTINGNVTGGASSTGLDSSSLTTIIGNVTGGTNAAAISSSLANIINVTGTVTASASSQAINMTNANGQVYLNGNMVNNNGKMAIFAPIVWLDKNNTTSAAFFTSGGVARTLYSADTVPNTPAASNVRSGTIYGAGNSLTGTLRMPTAANVRNGVVYDNGTTGTALFTVYNNSITNRNKRKFRRCSGKDEKRCYTTDTWRTNGSI